MTDPCRCVCHHSPNHEWLSAAVWEKALREPGFKEKLDRAMATPSEEYIPMEDVRAELDALEEAEDAVIEAALAWRADFASPVKHWVIRTDRDLAIAVDRLRTRREAAA